MNRQVRQMSRKLRRTVSKASSRVTDFVRSRSDYYYYPQRSTHITPTIPSSLSDSDDDAVFEATSADDDRLSTDDSHGTSITVIPCEFCNEQQTSENVTRHQLTCPQNPSNGRRRTHLAPNNIPPEPPRRRATSDYVSSAPSAPPRSRSPSPTQGFTIPEDLQCPILGTLFRDPVVASDGHTYERTAIINWLRTSQISPITRDPISIKTLNPNRIVQKMADDFRTECQRKKALYKYKLDVDVKKTEQRPHLITNTKTIYQAELIENPDLRIILTYLTGKNALKTAENNCRLEPHPNIVRTFGGVKHNDSSILLVQEYLPTQTLSQLIKHPDQKFSITILDTILYQIACGLEHLANREIFHGNVMADNVFIYQLDEIPENILVKLTNIGDFEQSEDLYSEKSDVYAFGILARELYSLELSTNDRDLIERQTLIERCLVANSNERPTFTELTKSIIDLICNKKFIYPSLT